MTNIMTSVKLHVKTLVSKKKKRFVKDNFNLDLSCECGRKWRA